MKMATQVLFFVRLDNIMFRDSRDTNTVVVSATSGQDLLDQICLAYRIPPKNIQVWTVSLGMSRKRIDTMTDKEFSELSKETNAYIRYSIFQSLPVSDV